MLLLPVRPGRAPNEEYKHLEKILQGFLEKQSPTGFRSFQKRWCVAHGNLFSYYKSQNDRDQSVGFQGLDKSCGQLDLGACSLLPSDGTNRFELVYGDRRYLLRAKDAGEATTWCTFLQQSITDVLAEQRTSKVAREAYPRMELTLYKQKLSSHGSAKNTTIQGWKLRFFKLIDGTITYYKHEGDTQPAGSISCHDILSLARSKNSQTEIEINVGGDSWKLRCDHAETMSRFFDSLNLSKAIMQAQSPIRSDEVNVDGHIVRPQNLDGWLFKSKIRGDSDGGTAWKRRFFYLDAAQGVLSYYKHKEDTSRIGFISIREITKLDIDGDQFTVATSGEQWRFKGDNRDESLLWYRHVRAVHENTKPVNA